MNTVWEILYARQMALHYAAPPICEVIFSGSSSPIIVLAEPQIGKVTGLVLGGAGGFTLSWNAFPGAICYNVYFIGGDNIAVPLAQCITDPFFTLPPNGPGELVVTPITLEGEGPPSDPIPYPTSGTFFLTITSEPSLGVPFSLGPADIHGAGSGVTSTSREFATGQQVFVTAELTHNFSEFNKWLLNGADYSENLTVSVFMNANAELTAVYDCGNEEDVEVPSDFTLSGPTSLGIFSIPPGTSPVVISGDAAASSYDFVYKGGSIRSVNPGGCGPSEECPGCCFLPPGLRVVYNNGANNTDLTAGSPFGDSCVVDQPTLESLVPLDKLEQFSHTGGSLLFQWDATVELDGIEFPIEDFECGDSCPQWEVIQDTGLIAQPSSWHIRDYEEWIALVLPMAKLDMGEAGCTNFTSANYPEETGADNFPWDGTSTQGFLHSHFYDASFYQDGIDQFIGPGPDFFPISIAGFEGSYSEVVGPRSEAFIIADIGGAGNLTDLFPTVDSDRYWYFAIWGSNFAPGPIWAGVKTGGMTPIGSYQRIACACPASAPVCMYLESGD